MTDVSLEEVQAHMSERGRLEFELATTRAMLAKLSQENEQLRSAARADQDQG